MNPDAGPIVKSSTAYLYLASTSLMLVRVGTVWGGFCKEFQEVNIKKCK
jgi:hypothetical protein